MPENFNRYMYRYLLASAVFMLGVGTVVYHYLEHWSWLNAYYFSVVTLATVGYGDLTPKTDFGKFFTTFYILIGVGIIGTFVSYNLRRNADKRAERREKRQKRTGQSK